MQVPAPEDFKHQDGYWVGPPWWARIPGADFDLFVSDGDDGPDAESLAFARQVLPRLKELRASAAEYIGQAVVVRGIPTLDAEIAQIVSIFCDGGSGTVILELNWEVDLYSLWYARFIDHPVTGLHPVEFGRRAWGGDIPRWRAPYRSVHG